MTTTETIYLPTDCWSMVLSFLPIRNRNFVGPTNKEIYLSLRNSFTGQSVMHLRCSRCVTDDKLALYASAKQIDLYFCHNITDAGLVHLKNVEVIDLAFNDNITDAGLAHLKNVKEINLSGCGNITDAGLEYLKNVKEISFQSAQITDAGLIHLKNAVKVGLYLCNNITDAGLAHLKNVKRLVLYDCKRVTDEGKQILEARGVKVARQFWCM
jgi:hypothetical protein